MKNHLQQSCIRNRGTERNSKYTKFSSDGATFDIFTHFQQFSRIIEHNNCDFKSPVHIPLEQLHILEFDKHNEE